MQGGTHGKFPSVQGFPGLYIALLPLGQVFGGGDGGGLQLGKELVGGGDLFRLLGRSGALRAGCVSCCSRCRRISLYCLRRVLRRLRGSGCGRVAGTGRLRRMPAGGVGHGNIAGYRPVRGQDVDDGVYAEPGADLLRDGRGMPCGCGRLPGSAGSRRIPVLAGSLCLRESGCPEPDPVKNKDTAGQKQAYQDQCGDQQRAAGMSFFVHITPV